ncbi:LPS translocon maturation chaperone LptM [Castellaniella sp. S9]|uniref:LPS translocon maturation chaperone LptM n=1 Tax=Castellaniella sp. S9 TaxID=2993652 RepID=UPI003FA460FE
MRILLRHFARRAGPAALLALLLSACGMKGPLTLPPPPPPDPALAAPPSVAPAAPPASAAPTAQP